MSCCQHVILRTCHLVNMSLCEHVNMSTCHVDILSTCEHVNISTCQHASLSACHHVIMAYSFGHFHGVFATLVTFLAILGNFWQSVAILLACKLVIFSAGASWSLRACYTINSYNPNSCQHVMIPLCRYRLSNVPSNSTQYF